MTTATTAPRDATRDARAAASRLLVISADCHAGALPSIYEAYLPKAYHERARRWWVAFAREMMKRAGTFFDQEAVAAYGEQARPGASPQGTTRNELRDDDDAVLNMLSDEASPFAPRRAEYDADARIRELDADGVAGEVIFPQMAPFGAGLMQYRHPISPDENLAGIRAYNRWLADFCNAHPGRHAGVALLNVDDIEVTVEEIRAAREAGLFGGVLLPTHTGEHPFYHHPRYEPIWSVCEELGMPVHTHSGWSPDYGDVESATAMYISEVAMWAQRPFTALVWSGAFERHENLRMVMTETGCAWILETLRILEMHADNPIFKYFSRNLSLRPSEYFARQCFIGASFMSRCEGDRRHQIGIDRLMWGTDYPHLEGTWPNTLASLRATFFDYPEEEVRLLLGANAAGVYGFDDVALGRVARRIGPTLESLRSGD